MTGHAADPAHVASCADCQARSSLEGLEVDLDRVWMNVVTEVWSRPVGRLERWLGAALRSPGLARALLTTPSLVLSWLLASAVVLGAGAFFTYQSDVPWVALLAPALAGIGIAYAYGPGVDPAWELSKTLVVTDRMVLLVRALAVFGVNAVLGLVPSLFSDQALAVTFLWLVPMTTVSALVLAAASWARSAPVGVGAGLMGWALIVVSASRGLSNWGAAVSEPDLLPAYAVATAVLIGVALFGTRNRRSEASLWR
jgi:hypothetical protein